MYSTKQNSLPGINGKSTSTDKKKDVKRLNQVAGAKG